MNGTLVPDDQARVPVTDHGLTTGDGVFEALKVAGGVPFALTRHLARLCSSAAGLGLPEPDLDQIRAGVDAVLKGAGRPDQARIRITVTAGESALGSQRTAAAPATIIQLGDLHDATPTCDVIMFPWPRNERGALAGVKTTSYAENVFALSYAQQRAAPRRSSGTWPATCARVRGPTCSWWPAGGWSRRRCRRAAWPG
jgi:branched-chain amino acid aminotransferase